MPKIYSFTHLAEPSGKGRPKFRRSTGHTYTPTKTRNEQANIAWTAKAAFGSPRLAGSLATVIHVYCQAPLSWSGRKRAAAINDETLRPDKKPDIDNIVKLYFDALNDIAWLDDKQIVTCIVHKRYAWQNGVKVTFWELPS